MIVTLFATARQLSAIGRGAFGPPNSSTVTNTSFCVAGILKIMESGLALRKTVVRGVPRPVGNLGDGAVSMA